MSILNIIFQIDVLPSVKNSEGRNNDFKVVIYILLLFLYKKGSVLMASITKRGKGYRIKVSCGYDINGKQITKSMTWIPDKNMSEQQMKKELNRNAVLFEEKCRNSQFIDSNIKFADFADIWIKDYAEKQLKAKTISRYKEFLKRINLSIGHLKLNKIQPTHLISFYENLKEENIREDIKYKSKDSFNLSYNILKSYPSKTAFAKKAGISSNTLNNACKGYNISKTTAIKISDTIGLKLSDIFDKNSDKTTLSNKTIQHYHRFISSILQTAVHWQILASNPCARIKAPKSDKKERSYLDDKEAIELINCLNHEPSQFKTMVIMLIYTGMRRGEICGLKWSDVDFNNKILNIQRNILYLPNLGIFEDTTKTESSKRAIKVSDIVIQLLQSQKISQNKKRIKCGDQWSDNNYIFTQWNGKPIHPDSLTGWFHKFLEKHNFPEGISIHSLRHTNASLLIANGVNLTTVSKRLGHSNTATTTQIYAHAIKNADEMASDTLQNILNIKTK